MFKIESYVTPILLSYVDKYVRDFKPADAQVSLWGGGVTLHNLVLKADVLQKEVALPFTLVSGRIHELLIQVPWTKIMSEPIVVTINTIECILSLNPPPDDTSPPENQSSRTHVVEAPPGYMQALVRRIVSNIAVRVHSLIVKYVHDDVILSLNVKHLAIDSVGPNWEPAFADIEQNQPTVRRLIRLDDLTLCLDKSDSDGKIRFFHEPLLYRCQLDLRVLTRLISANTRRARSLNIQLISSHLAWGVSNEQLVLLLRLFRERTPAELKSFSPLQPSVTTIPINVSSPPAEVGQTESWSEWAWSWLPTWMDSEEVEETPAPHTPVPIAFTAHFEQISLVLKIMELDSGNRKRARGILELRANDAVVRSSLCSPTLLRLKLGTRLLTLTAHGKCVCGLLDASVNLDKPTVYLKKVSSESEETWSWEQELTEPVVETGVAVDEKFEASSVPQETADTHKAHAEEEYDEFWKKMAPVIYFEYNQDRSPPDPLTNPYDNPPQDFEYSDWVEEHSQKIILRPISIDISTGLLHRLEVLKNALKNVPIVDESEMPTRILTIEECDALSENLPQRRTNVKINGLLVRLVPSDHALERNTKSPLVLDLLLPYASVLITSPLYPHRVCSAACQMLEDSDTLLQAVRLHISAKIDSLQAGVSSPDDSTSRVCARANIQFVTHSLLNSRFFKKDKSILFGYNLAIQEANISGSSARLQAAYHVLSSFKNEKLAAPLLQTTLATDALNDEESAAIDVTFEDLKVRGYVTRNINTHFLTLESARATAFHSPGGKLKQAWLFSAPETSATTYLRVSLQWCKVPNPSSLEFFNLGAEATAISIDPLLLAWLGYQPKLKPDTDSKPQVASQAKSMPSQYFSRRMATPPSSGRGVSRSASGAELVHMRPRSVESSSERSERKQLKLSNKTQLTETWWHGARDSLLKLHERLNRLLLTADVGLVQIYITPSSVSALDSVTIREAMERNTTIANRVFVINMGRFLMQSNSQMKYLWQDVRIDRPTYERRDPDATHESFPWKTHLSDVSCYTLEVRAGTESSGRDKSAVGLKSQLKASRMVVPRTLLDLVTTTITLSVVTKSIQIKTFKKTGAKPKQSQHREDDKTKYFTSGADFKPSSLKEFIRGPIRRKKDVTETKAPETLPEPTAAQTDVTTGPVVSLGVYLHADTPPIKFKLDQDQILTAAAAAHCISHVVTLLKQPPFGNKLGSSSFSISQKSLKRSTSELDAKQSFSEETASENRSEQLVSIFEAYPSTEAVTKLKTFFWFQWVVSHATLIIASPEVKIAFDVDDIISTVDLQNHYNQLKVKVASASIKNYKRTGGDEWTPGLLGGRILEVREPADITEENNFLAVTVTQARISNLPVSWKEQYSKALERNSGVDYMWEVYATLAPLEIVLEPDVLNNVMSWIYDLKPLSLCSLNTAETRPSEWEWPFLYVAAGGLRLLLTKSEENKEQDDTLMLVIGKVSVTPNPENPICRQSVYANAESSWTSPGLGLEGQQYEVLINNLAVQSARFTQLVSQEEYESDISKGTGGENPALKWSQPIVSPVITPILHSMDVGCMFAPALYNNGALAIGPAVELNLLSDCSIELAVERLKLLQSLANSLLNIYHNRPESFIFLDEDSTCPYAAHLGSQNLITESSPTASEVNLCEEPRKSSVDLNRSLIFDSGVETVTSQSTNKVRRESAPYRKSVSTMSVDHTEKASDYLEVFVTMGVIDISIYVGDDNSPEVNQLKPPPGEYKMRLEKPKVQVIIDENKHTKNEGRESIAASRSLSETVRNADISRTKTEGLHIMPLARKGDGNVPLLHATLHQPNLYYWKRKKQKTAQVSLFNAWIGLGVGLEEGHWHAPLLNTSRGTPDPVTDIPPTLATLKIETCTGYKPMSGTSGQGSMQLDIERPVICEVSTDRLRRLKGIKALIEKHISYKEKETVDKTESTPLLCRVRNSMVANRMEKITIQTGQIGVRGSEGAAGWEAWQTQLTADSRPERLACRTLLSALSVSAGPATDRRHVVLQPTTLGGTVNVTWDAWRKAEGSASSCEPTTRVGIDLDQVILDLRPCDLEAAIRTHQFIIQAFNLQNDKPQPDPSNESANTSFFSKYFSSDSIDANVNHHYYKDDLRSGAFKLIAGCQLPMAYQVTLFGDSVSWRYPHPRAITKIIAYPIPGQDEEVECVLDLYCPMLDQWEPHTYFKLPVSEPREMQLTRVPQEAIFALMWRVRVCSETEEKILPYEFDPKKYSPRIDPISTDPPASSDNYKKTVVTAEQLSGILRVDSYFDPRLMPSVRLAIRMAALEVNAHNSLPVISNLLKENNPVGGYYVSPNLARSHRVLALRMRDTVAHCVVAASTRMLLRTHLSSDIINTSTGRMEQIIEEFRIQGTLWPAPETRARVRVAGVHLALHLPRISTLRSLVEDWTNAHKSVMNEIRSSYTMEWKPAVKDVKAALCGRVSLWIHNTTASALRVGQEKTDELILVTPGASIAYRWRLPTAPKKLRFSLASAATDWHWSKSIPFAEGKCRVKLEDGEVDSNRRGKYLHVRVEDSGSRRDMSLSGRLVIANMLRYNLLYKVRGRCIYIRQTMSSGELQPEKVGLSIICDSELETVLKVKFISDESGWSGDIPLNECPKENVPWLVKVPREDTSYMSVWCRVVRASSDNCLIATLWPLYMLRSHLPLDADVIISSEPTRVSQSNESSIVQSAAGRGAVTHLIVPGTTAARHKLTFQYKNVDCPVTRDAVPLHYGVTDTSVFDKPATINSTNDAIDILDKWLKESSQETHSNWPYSIVTNHWPGVWQPACLQPRCDVSIRYRPIRAGGGCSLELQLCPVVLIANASPVALTLRGHDAAPLCKLEAGVAMSPPSAVLQKPFFMSIEKEREMFVSGELRVCEREPGRYESPPSGHVALDRSTNFVILCNQKVVLLTMYYEIKQDINILGITTTYVIINRLTTDILVSTVAVPNEIECALLQPKTFKHIPITKQESLKGAPLCHFWMSDRWRGRDAEELRGFLCLALPSNRQPATNCVPIRLGSPPLRRAIALIDHDGISVPVVVTQVQHEGRWVITVAPDPCPQFVVHNRTNTTLAVAQPVDPETTPLNPVQVVQECPGVKWWRIVNKDGVTHYTTPAYCARFPPPTQAALPRLPFLTVGYCQDKLQTSYKWCLPIAIADGEQLLQLPGKLTIKVQIRTHPHSSLIEFLDVNQHDISASDIRRRLLGAFSEESSRFLEANAQSVQLKVSAEENLRGAISALQQPSNISNKAILRLELSTQQDEPLTTLKASSVENSMTDGSNVSKLSNVVQADITPSYNNEDKGVAALMSKNTKNYSDTCFMEAMSHQDWSEGQEEWSEKDRLRCVIDSIEVTLGASADALPLVAAHAQRFCVHVFADTRKIRTTLSIADVQIDNAQYETEQYDFAVVATTRSDHARERWPPLWGMFNEVLAVRPDEARFLLRTCHDRWTVVSCNYHELTEVELRLGPLGLYIEDAYVGAAVDLFHLAIPPTEQTSNSTLSEVRSLEKPFRLRKLQIHPLNLTLTLHTAVHMYIALDESPLRLSAFQLQDVMTSTERLTHALTVHYLSAAILGAGWVVGGLELLGAPGALAARVGSAGGGVRGVASAAAGALLRSLSAAAGSLARNLDLLAGDDDHARRAAAARRHPPPSLMAGLVAGISNFAINILGAVGGLAHHPLVGVAVGESESGATALRRGIIGAITKPLSATADLVAYAGHGLLTQTGWDCVPQPKASKLLSMSQKVIGWRRDCVRWEFLLSEIHVLCGFNVKLEQVPLQLLITHKFLVIAESETERILEMIDLKYCTLAPYQGQFVEVLVIQKPSSNLSEIRVNDENNEFQVSAAAMARVARYTGASGAQYDAARVLALLPAPASAHSLHAALCAALHSNNDCYFPLL